MEFPPEFRMYTKDPATRAAFVSENTSPNPDDCKNCGGVGYLFIFVATGGPFRDPTQNKVNHWTKEGWWIGKTYQALCPVCKATEFHGEIREDKAAVDKETHILAGRWDLKEKNE